MEENNELFDLNNLLLEDDENLNEGDDFNPFAEEQEDEEENIETNEDDDSEEIEESKSKKKDIAEEKSPENVGNDEEEESAFPEDKGTSPKLYSSIAKVLKEEGTFPDLKDEDLDSIKDAQTTLATLTKGTQEWRGRDHFFCYH